MRALHHRTFEKTLIAVCKDNEPFVVQGTNAQKNYLVALQKKLSGMQFISYVSMGTRGSSGSDLYDYLYVRVTEDNAFYVHFNKQNQLIIKTYYSESELYMSGMITIQTLFDALAPLYEALKNKDIKNKKIKQLKKNTIIAFIKNIAEKEGFKYQYTEMTHHINLQVKLNDRDALTIRVPFKRFQEVMQQMTPVLKTIRELMERDITIGIKPFDKYVRWITPSASNNENDEEE